MSLLLTLPFKICSGILTEWIDKPMLIVLRVIDKAIQGDKIRYNLLQLVKHLKDSSYWRVKDIGFSWSIGFHVKKLYLHGLPSKAIQLQKLEYIEEIFARKDIPTTLFSSVIVPCVSLKKITVDRDTLLQYVSEQVLNQLTLIKITRETERVEDLTLHCIEKNCHNLQVLNIVPSLESSGFAIFNNIVESNPGLKELYSYGNKDIFRVIGSSCSTIQKIHIKVDKILFADIGCMIRKLADLVYVQVDSLQEPGLVYDVTIRDKKIVDILLFDCDVSEMNELLNSFRDVTTWRLPKVPVVDSNIQSLLQFSTTSVGKIILQQCQQLTHIGLSVLLSQCVQLTHLEIQQLSLTARELLEAFNATPSTLRELTLSCKDLTVSTVIRLLYKITTLQSSIFLNVCDDSYASKYNLPHELRNVLMNVNTQCTHCHVGFVQSDTNKSELIYNGRFFRGTNVDHYLTADEKLKKKKLSRRQKRDLGITR